MRTQRREKPVKINVFRTQEIKLKACSSPECLFKKICLILVIIARFVALTCSIPILCPSIYVSLKTNSLIIIIVVKNSKLTATGEAYQVWISKIKSPKFSELLFDLSGQLPEILDSLGFSIFDVTRSLFFANSPILQAFFKTNSGNCLITQLPEVVITVGANRSVTKKLKRKKWRMQYWKGI